MEPVSGKTEVIVPQVKEQLKQMMNASDRKPVEAEETEGNAQEEIRRMVIPTWSAAQIAETARSQVSQYPAHRPDFWLSRIL